VTQDPGLPYPFKQSAGATLDISVVVHVPGCDQWTVQTGSPLPTDEFEKSPAIHLRNHPGGIVDFVAETALIAINEKTIAPLLHAGFFPHM
jgi:hypothetical protein